METQKRNKLFDWLFPAAISLVVFISVVIWLQLDTRLPHWDMGRHMYHALEQRTVWYGFFQGDVSLGGLLTHYMYYPPLEHQLGLLFGQIFGFSSDHLVWSNLFWMLILSYSLYNILLKYSTRLVSFFSLLFIYSSPILIGQIREFQLDFPFLALFSLAIFLLVKTDFLSSRKFSIFFGIVFGLGMLLKWTFIAYGMPLFLVYFIYSLIRNNKDRKKILKNTILIAFLGLIVSGPWYYRNYGNLRHDFSINGISQAEVEGDPHGFNLPSYIWYGKSIKSSYLTVFMAIPLILGVIVIFRKLKKYWAIPVLFLVYYLIFSTLPNKDVRYIFPLFSLIAIAGSFSFVLFKNKYYKACLAILFIAFFVINNITVAYSKFVIPEHVPSQWEQDWGVYLVSTNGYTSSSPEDQVCPLESVVDLISKNSSAREIGVSNIDFSDWAVAFSLVNNGRIWSGQVGDPLNSDYLISRNTNLDIEMIDTYLKEDLIIKVRSFECKDGSEVTLFKVVK